MDGSESVALTTLEAAIDVPEPVPAPCRVLISYAHDSDDREHGVLVRRLWEFLRSCGVDARLDLSAAARRRDWALWMADEIRVADIVLVVASAAYRERAEGRSAPDEGQGVQWEARLIRDAFYVDRRAMTRFVPVVLPGQTSNGVPDFLAPNTATVYHVTDFSLDGAEDLLRLLTGQPGTIEPPLGPIPALPPRPSARPRPAPDRVEDHRPGVHNEVTGTVTGTVIQAGSIGSVHTYGSDDPRRYE